LLGDAAHVMLFAGPGVNLAMANGADLGLALAKVKTDSELLEHVREYDTAMQERTREEWEVAMQIADLKEKRCKFAATFRRSTIVVISNVVDA
jgi:2-polyprenyl-6-methoxyphenol hydroxylase-like FAD-dependent oxidoreductase